MQAAIAQKQNEWMRRLLPHQQLVERVYLSILLGFHRQLCITCTAIYVSMVWQLTRTNMSAVAFVMLAFTATSLVDYVLRIGLWTKRTERMLCEARHV